MISATVKSQQWAVTTCAYATAFICPGLSGHSPFGGTFPVPVANSHSGAGLEASGRWGWSSATFHLCRTHPAPVPLVKYTISRLKTMTETRTMGNRIFFHGGSSGILTQQREGEKKGEEKEESVQEVIQWTIASSRIKNRSPVSIGIPPYASLHPSLCQFLAWQERCKSGSGGKSSWNESFGCSDWKSSADWLAIFFTFACAA